MINYKPRNDFVVIRIVKVDTLRGIAVPETSIEGKEFVVVAVGPKVENLNPADNVMILGTQGQDYGFIPGSSDLIVTKESNVALVVEEIPSTQTDYLKKFPKYMIDDDDPIEGTMYESQR